MTLQFSGSGNPVTVDGTNYGLYPTLMTSQTGIGLTSNDFTGIPSWARRITVMFNGVKTSGAANKLIQLGTSVGVTTTGYVTSGAQFNPNAGSSGAVTSTSGFILQSVTSADVIYGSFVFTLVSGNSWVGTYVSYQNSTPLFGLSAGTVTLSNTLTSVRLTTTNGTDTFTAGSANVLYE